MALLVPPELHHLEDIRYIKEHLEFSFLFYG